MKKSIFIIITGLLMSTFAFSQTTWNGTALTGNTYRSGNVGIGTGMTNPLETLHINGNIRGNGTAGALRINTTEGYIDIGPMGNNYANIYTDERCFLFNKQVLSATGDFGSYNTNPLKFWTGGTGGSNGALRMIIWKDNGNVGIGTSITSSPLEKLHVAGNVYIEGSITNHLSTNKNFQISSWEIGGSGSLTLNAFNGDAHIPMSFAASRFYFHAGAVGIGTTNTQGYKLAVSGGILCQEIKVVTNVPSSDYVFEDDYKLKSLSEVEAFVKENKHLPEVPSAEEFKENGYKVGEMDDLLLRKVEELTLYVIELEKQVQKLK